MVGSSELQVRDAVCLGSAHPKGKLEIKISLTSVGSKVFVYNLKSRRAGVHMEPKASLFSLGLYYQGWDHFPVPCLSELPCPVLLFNQCANRNNSIKTLFRIWWYSTHR